MLPQHESLREGTHWCTIEAVISECLFIAFLDNVSDLLLELLRARYLLKCASEVGTQVRDEVLHRVVRVEQGLRPCHHRPVISTRPTALHAHYIFFDSRLLHLIDK